MGFVIGMLPTLKYVSIVISLDVKMEKEIKSPIEKEADEQFPVSSTMSRAVVNYEHTAFLKGANFTIDAARHKCFMTEKGEAVVLMESLEELRNRRTL